MSRSYQTRQQDAIVAFFQSRPDDCYTADQAYLELVSDDKDVSKTTVYRTITKLCETGILRRYIAGDAASFQFNHCHSAHMHMRCTRCGKVFHLHCEEVESFGGHLLSCHGFQLDESQTILYGKCAECAVSGGGNQ